MNGHTKEYDPCYSLICVLAYFFFRRKLTQKLQETEEALSSATQKASNAEKAKNRLNSELEDALIDLEKVSLFADTILQYDERQYCTSV